MELQCSCRNNGLSNMLRNRDFPFHAANIDARPFWSKAQHEKNARARPDYEASARRVLVQVQDGTTFVGEVKLIYTISSRTFELDTNSIIQKHPLPEFTHLLLYLKIGEIYNLQVLTGPNIPSSLKFCHSGPFGCRLLIWDA